MTDNKQKVFFTLSEEAIEIINQRAPSVNKRGEWISKAITDYDYILSHTVTYENGVGLLEQVADRLAIIEKQIALVLAKVA